MQPGSEYGVQTILSNAQETIDNKVVKFGGCEVVEVENWKVETGKLNTGSAPVRREVWSNQRRVENHWVKVLGSRWSMACAKEWWRNAYLYSNDAEPSAKRPKVSPNVQALSLIHI